MRFAGGLAFVAMIALQAAAQPARPSSNEPADYSEGGHVYRQCIWTCYANAPCLKAEYETCVVKAAVSRVKSWPVCLYEDGSYRYQRVADLFPSSTCKSMLEQQLAEEKATRDAKLAADKLREEAQGAERAKELARRAALDREIEERRRDEMAAELASRAQEQRRVDEERRQRDLASKAELVRRRDVLQGKAQPANFAELLERDRVPSGLGVIESPRVKADGLRYGAAGRIEVADGESGFTARGDGGYYHVRIPDSLRKQYLAVARIGQLMFVVGRYKNNVQYTTLDGRIRVMPVFEADSIWNQK